MQRLLIILFCSYFILFVSIFHTRTVLAEESSSPEDIQELLGKGLTIYEIDQEVLRLSEREAALSEEIEQVTLQAADQEILVAERREQAGKILRAYYKGHRENLWMLIFRADSFYEALQVYYYLTLIYKHDQKILQEHTDTYRRLQQMLDKLHADRTELVEVKAEYLAQRARLVALEEELERELAAREDGAAIQDEIDALTRIWETKGLPIFKHYFNELAKAIQLLPEEIISNGNLKLQDGRFRMTISDEELTEFMRSQNPDDFANFTFSFADDDLFAYGAEEETAISIRGYYELNEEENIIAFHLTKLVYNGFELPDTTVRAMNEQFDLNVYPDLLEMPIKVKTTGVTIQEGTLIIEFVLDR